MTQLKSNRIRIALVAVLVLLIAVIGGLILSQQEDNDTPDVTDSAATASDPFLAAAIEDPPFESIAYGVQPFLWWDDGWSAGKNMDWVLMMQFTWVKQIFAWEDLELEPGVWDWSRADFIVDELESRDIGIVARLGHVPNWAHPELPDRGEGYVDAPPAEASAWVNYCGTFAERYQGRVQAYQIWNEPNLSREWGGQEPDAAGYVEMLRLCSEAIRAVDPDAILISAGLAPTGGFATPEGAITAIPDDTFLRQMYDNNFQQYIDVVGIHAPGFSEPSYGPDEAENDGLQRWQAFRRPEDLREIMIEYGDEARQMAILELGYTTNTQNDIYSWFAVTEEQQADYLVEAYSYIAENWRPWVGLVTLIYIASPGWSEEDEEFWFAIDNPITFETRPAFGAIVQMEKYCGDITLPARSPEETAGVPDGPNPCN